MKKEKRTLGFLSDIGMIIILVQVYLVQKGIKMKTKTLF